jgi:hypothetical protein
MIRYILVLFLLTGLTIPASSQTWEEWFRQKETQKEYLVQQIAAIQAYAGTLRQGYHVLSQGISTVQHIKNGDLGLHQAFFHSLRQVSPSLGQSAKFADILLWQAAILRDFNTTLQALGLQEQLIAHEMAYLEEVKVRILQACARDMEVLWLLATNETLSISEDERLRQLETIHQAMRARFQFTRYFLSEAQGLSLLRTRAKTDLATTRFLQGIPNPE